MPMQLLVGPYALSGMNRNVRDIEAPGELVILKVNSKMDLA